MLEVRDVPDPQPNPGQVLVQVEAAGVNFADIMARMGLYPDSPKLPAVVGYEAAGIVAVGAILPSTRAMARFQPGIAAM